MVKWFFDISTGFRFSKLHFGSVPSIPVAVLGLPYFDSRWWPVKITSPTEGTNDWLGGGVRQTNSPKTQGDIIQILWTQYSLSLSSPTHTLHRKHWSPRATTDLVIKGEVWKALRPNRSTHGWDNQTPDALMEDLTSKTPCLTRVCGWGQQGRARFVNSLGPTIPPPRKGVLHWRGPKVRGTQHIPPCSAVPWGTLQIGIWFVRQCGSQKWKVRNPKNKQTKNNVLNRWIA
jgi:hypothetical protein